MLTEVLEIESSKEPGDQKNRDHFKRQKLPWLRSYLLEEKFKFPVMERIRERPKPLT